MVTRASAARGSVGAVRPEFLWYIPNEVTAGHRGDAVVGNHNSLATLTAHALAIEARTTTFQPLVAVRPGYCHPAHFVASAATLDPLSGGRVLVNVVSGRMTRRPTGTPTVIRPSATPARPSSCGSCGRSGRASG
nr:LLM class flavin-dependent oxidoreductase [Cryptosporangium arvum]